MEFATLDNFPHYRFGSDGSVWSQRNGRWGVCDTWRKLKPATCKSGYLTVAILDKGGTQKSHYVHRLILEAFVGPCDGADCRHGNGVRSDNAIENLSWGTRADNMADAREHGSIGHGDLSPLHKLSEWQIPHIRRLLSIGFRQRDIAAAFGVTRGCIGQVNRGFSWKGVA